ncbi:MAG: cobalt ECF transporter T component CbiQ [Cyanobacteria bacterium J06639_14]
MKLGLEHFAHLNSPIHRWAPVPKLLGLGTLIFAFSSVQTLIVLPGMMVITAGLFSLSRLPLTFWWQRLKLPGLFLIGLVIALPFISGETPIFQWGILRLYGEGLQAVVLISVRFVCILTLGLILFGTAPFLNTITALRSLGLPPLLADMILLSYRYIYEIGDYFQSMRKAVKLRGFRSDRPNLKTLKTLSALAGSLIIRSYEQSEQVYKAMLMRGYGQGASVAERARFCSQDWALLGVTVGSAIAILLAEVLLG